MTAAEADAASPKQKKAENVAQQKDLKQKGNDCLQSNKKSGFMDAADYYTQALELGEFDKELTSQLYSNRAHVNLMLSKFVEAVDDCRKGIVANPQNVKCYWRAGRASISLELYEQAKKFVQDGLAIDKDNSELKNLHVQCQKKLAAQMKAKKGIECTPAEAQEQKDRVDDLGEKTMLLHTQVQTNERESKRCQLTLNSLNEIPVDVPLYKPVGRTFILEERSKFESGLHKEIEKLNKDAPKLRKQRDEMAQRRQNADKEFQQMVLGLQNAARQNQEAAQQKAQVAA